MRIFDKFWCWLLRHNFRREPSMRYGQLIVDCRCRRCGHQMRETYL